MREIVTPDYGGAGLSNLMAEIEVQLTGTSASPRLSETLRTTIPDSESYVLILFDGLGDRQLEHPAASGLAAARRGTIDAPFPFTTTTSLATIATGLPPSQHGLIAYQLWLEEANAVVNTIHLTTLRGEPIKVDYDTFLPSPNTWERLRTAQVESIAIQPDHFDRTPLTRVLYRGARFDPYRTLDEAIDRTVEAASSPNRLVFLYIPEVDFAAHLGGQESDIYSEAMEFANAVWSGLSGALPDSVGLIGTADHGHVDLAEPNKIPLSQNALDGLTIYGAERAAFIKGDGAALAEGLPATWVPTDDHPDLWGPGPYHASFAARRPDGILFADDSYGLFHRHSHHRLVGFHGGLMPQEREIPLLVRS